MDSNFLMQSSMTTVDRIWCIIDGDIVYQTDMTGARRQIGYTTSAYNELQDTTTEYYEKLVELGVIVPEKTTEDVLKETQNTMLEMAQIMKSLQDEITQLKAEKGVGVHDEFKRNSETGINNVSAASNSKSNRGSTAKDTGGQ